MVSRRAVFRPGFTNVGLRPNQALHRTRPRELVLGVQRSLSAAGPVSGVVGRKKGIGSVLEQTL